MAYKPTDQLFPVITDGKVKKSGGGMKLPMFNLALVNTNEPTKDGAKIVEQLSDLPKNHKLSFRVGTPGDGTLARTETNKPLSTPAFKLSDITNVYVDAPIRAGALQDDVVIGFNGKEGSEIDLEVGENENIKLTLSEDLIGMLGEPTESYDIEIPLTAPTEGLKGVDWTMHEVVTKAYENLKKETLPGGVPVTNYVDMMLVNSENPDTIPGTDITVHEIRVYDDNSDLALSNIQSKYPDLEVFRKMHASGESVYVAMTEDKPEDYKVEDSYTLPECDECPGGYTLEDGVCKSEVNITYAWYKGDTCKINKVKYRITLANDNCQGDRLQELQDAYPELTITKVPNPEADDNCQGTYETEVPTNIICEECSPIFRDTYVPDVKLDVFKEGSWELVNEDGWDPEAKMGIRIRAKQIEFTHNDFYVNDSVKIGLVGGLPGECSMNYLCGTSGQFTVKYFSKKAPMQNLGVNFKDKYSKAINSYFRGRYGNFDTGFKDGKQYVTYSVTIDPKSGPTNFLQPQTNAYTFTFPVEVGKHKDIEALMNMLAKGVGLDKVNAFNN